MVIDTYISNRKTEENNPSLNKGASGYASVFFTLFKYLEIFYKKKLTPRSNFKVSKKVY